MTTKPTTQATHSPQGGHTPGPWSLTTGGDVTSNRRGLIAAIRFQGGANTEGRANARVIAAAPEMLDALVRFMAIRHPNVGSWTLAEKERSLKALEDQALAAIAKATGGAK